MEEWIEERRIRAKTEELAWAACVFCGGGGGEGVRRAALDSGSEVVWEWEASPAPAASPADPGRKGFGRLTGGPYHYYELIYENFWTKSQQNWLTMEHQIDSTLLEYCNKKRVN